MLCIHFTLVLLLCQAEPFVLLAPFSLVGSDDTASILCLQDSQRQREMVEQRYTKYKEIVWDLQHQLDESRRRIQEYRVRHSHTDRCNPVHYKKELYNALQELVLPNNPHLFYFGH